MKEFINITINGLLGNLMIIYFSVEIIKNIFNFIAWLLYLLRN